MSINASLLHINQGTAKTFEHLGTGFSFRAVGDGAVEPALLDLFSPTDNIAETLSDRRLRQYVAAEAAFTKPENAVASNEEGEARLQKVVAETLGQGWSVEEFYKSYGGLAGRTVVTFKGQGGVSQSVDIEHRDEKKVSLKAEAMIGGWSVRQYVNAPVEDGQIKAENVDEQVFFTRG
jgi:hypothetical protein